MKTWALEKIKKLWSWYKLRPTWQKCILWVVLILAVVLFLVAIVGSVVPSPRIESDKAHTNMVDNVHSELQTAEEKQQAEILKRKQLIATQLNQMDKTDAETLRRRDQINKATTFRELDALQEELDL